MEFSLRPNFFSLTPQNAILPPHPGWPMAAASRCAYGQLPPYAQYAAQHKNHAPYTSRPLGMRKASDCGAGPGHGAPPTGPGPPSARCNMPLPTTAKPGAHAVLGPAAWPSIVGDPGGGCAMSLSRLRRMQAAAVSAHATPKRLGSLQAVLVLCLCVMQVAPRRKFCMPECSTCISGAYSIEHVHY